MTKKIDSLGVKTLRLDDNMRIENTFAVQGEDLRGLKITFVTNKGEVVKDDEIEVKWTFQVESEGEVYTLTEPVVAERVEEGDRYFYIIRYPSAVTHFAGIGQAQLAVYKKRKKLLSKPYNLRVYKNVSYIPKDIVELEGHTERLQALINRAEDRDVETLKIQEESRALNTEQREVIDSYQKEFDELLEKQEVSGEELITLYTQKHEELMSKLTNEQVDLFSVYEDKHSEVLKETNQINLNSKELQETLEALKKDLELKISTYLENLDAVKKATEESKAATSESIKRTEIQKEETAKSQKATEESLAATKKAADTTQKALEAIEDSIEATKRAKELNEESEGLIESHEVTMATGRELISQGETLSQIAKELIAKMEVDLEKSEELKDLLSTGQEMISQGTAMISRGEEVLSQAEKVIQEVSNAIEIGVDEKVQQVIEDKIKLLSVSYTQLEDLPSLNGVKLIGNVKTDDLGIKVPEKTSQLTNDSNFIKNQQSAPFITEGDGATTNYGSTGVETSSTASLFSWDLRHTIKHKDLNLGISLGMYGSGKNYTYGYLGLNRQNTAMNFLFEKDNNSIKSVDMQVPLTLNGKAIGLAKDIPSKVSQLENDESYIDHLRLTKEIQEVKSEIPKKISQLTNDEGYASAADLENKADKEHMHSANDIHQSYSKNFVTMAEKLKIGEIDSKASIDHEGLGRVRDTHSNQMMEMWIGTQDQYDQINKPSDSILYIIKEE